MNEETRELLRRMAQTAADLGPALAPVGHEEMLGSITATAKDLFDAAACSLALLEGRELVFHVASGAGADEVIGLRVPITSGIAGWVVSSGQSIAIADVRRDARFAQQVAESTGYVPTSILAMPLETERRMLGVIEVLDRNVQGRDTSRDMELLALFAKQAALAIEGSAVFSDLGSVLFSSLERLTDDDDLAAALRSIADDATGPDPALAGLAGAFAELNRMGRREKETAARVLLEITRHARR
jgi:GAF domain-containing protein